MKRGISFLIIILLVLGSLNVLGFLEEGDCVPNCRNYRTLALPNAYPNNEVDPGGVECYRWGLEIGEPSAFRLWDCDPYGDENNQYGTCADGDEGLSCYLCEIDGQPNPDIKEVCDGVDNDCDGKVDEDKNGDPLDCGECPVLMKSVKPSDDFYKELLAATTNSQQDVLSDSEEMLKDPFI
jgi:hypothetical protein